MNIRVRPTVVLFDYAPNMPIRYQDLQDDMVVLNIDHAKGFAFKVDDIDKAQSDINIMNEATQDGAQQMKIGIERVVLSTVYSDAQWVQPVATLDKNNVVDWLVDCGTPLTDADIPDEERWILVPPKVEALLQKSPITQSAQVMGDDVSVLRKRGWIGNLAGFDVFRTTNLVTAGGNVQVIAGHKSAITFAAQVSKVETLRPESTFGDAVRGLNTFGYKVIVPHGLVSAPVNFA